MKRMCRLCQWSVCATLLFALGSATEAGCVNPGGTGGCVATIGAAVAAAAAGETIAVAPGTYRETGITISGLDGLVIKGQGVNPVTGLPPNPSKVIVDGGGSGNVFAMDSAGVKIKNLTVLNAGNSSVAVTANGTGSSLNDVWVRGLAGFAGDCIFIDVGADNVHVARADIKGCGFHAIDASADGLLVKNSVISLANEGAIQIFGNNAVLRNNVIDTIEDFDCIFVQGNNAQITGNILANCDGFGIDVFGDTVTISSNEVTGMTGTGIFVSGADPTVTLNTVTFTEGGFDISCDPCAGGAVSDNVAQDVMNDSTGFVISAEAAGLVVERNIAQRATQDGFSVSGTGITLNDNQALANGAESEKGFSIFGTDHTLQNNIAKGNVGDGFSVTGSGHTLTGNKAQSNNEDGFDVQSPASDVTLSSNLAMKNGGVGIELSVGVTGITVIGNTAKKNRLDFCDESSATSTVSGNVFGSQDLDGGCEQIGD